MGTVGSIIIHFNLYSKDKDRDKSVYDIFEPRPNKYLTAKHCDLKSPLLRK